MQRKNIYIAFAIILSLLFITGCNNSKETLLTESEKSDFSIIFGEKIGENEVKARNIFHIGETPYFVVTARSESTMKDLKIQISKNSGEKWEVITEAPYNLQGEWKQFMNGIPAKIFEQLGPGAYRLTILNGEEKLVSGDFVFQKK